MNTLIIYETYPVAIDMFLIPDKEIDNTMRSVFQTCAGKFINETDTTEETQQVLDKLFFWLFGGESENKPSKQDIEYNELLSKYHLTEENKFNIQKPISWVITTGFME